ncbi:Glycerol-3-phosphate acyltransferase 3 [Trichoplax sp. H2]|nr:Glycerol-3-phosphate acyltransferase 3 [Trichoplax sp. H2]|eukprot:RDD43542.1 Glycerol-3-phosphate acyltransferase 3 [Trichoplax sp. H2]
MLLFLLGIPLILILTIVVIPASLNISFGVRDCYVNTLRKIFEFGRGRIERTKRHDDEQYGDESDQHPVPSLPSRMLSENDTNKKKFSLDDMLSFAACGMQAIVDDEITKCFSAEELPSWNLLTRTNKNYEYISLRLTILWIIGWCIRYLIFLPVRITILSLGLLWLCLATTLIGLLPKSSLQTKLNHYAYLIAFRVLARAISASIRVHNRENRAKGGGICVANHTSPIDVLILSTDNCYAMGQCKEFFQVLNLMFGTCINNTSVFMFKKGSFEIGGTIHPAAIKYDPTFGDAFWNSSRESWVQYLVMMLTSWAIVCDVWYLPPRKMEPPILSDDSFNIIQENETATEFANRVKAEIAEKGGLVDLVWDGQLKRVAAKAALKYAEQEKYSEILLKD